MKHRLEITACFQDNINHNCLAGRVQMHPFALERAPGTLAFDLGPDDQTGWGGLAANPSNRTVNVEVRRLDEVIPPGVRIDVLKVDTEEADAWVIEGAAELLKHRRIMHIFYEENRERMCSLGVSAGQAMAVLKQHGYLVRQMEGNLNLCEFYATLATSR